MYRDVFCSFSQSFELNLFTVDLKTSLKRLENTFDVQYEIGLLSPGHVQYGRYWVNEKLPIVFLLQFL